MMAESYFKDPLLAKWAAGASADALAVLRKAGRLHGDLDAIDALSALTAMNLITNSNALAADTGRLAIAVRTELSGARRAREKAEHIVRQCGSAEDRDQGQQAAMECAQDILEAFDGE